MRFERTWVSFANIWLSGTIFILSFAFALEGPFPQWGYFWIAITALLLLPLLSAYSISSFSIDKIKGVLLVESSKWWFVKQIKEYPLDSISASLTSEINKMGRKHQVFKIYSAGNKIGEMVPWFAGWHRKTIEQFINAIKTTGIIAK